MNCPSRTDNVDGREGWNQNPNLLEAATREDFNGRTNAVFLRRLDVDGPDDEVLTDPGPDSGPDPQLSGKGTRPPLRQELEPHPSAPDNHVNHNYAIDHQRHRRWCPNIFSAVFSKCQEVVMRFSKFVGPGFMIAVAYIDPGNYSTDIAAGASYRFKLLFIVLMSNIFAIFLQSLCIKLGTVSGMDLAQMCRAHLPRWLNYFLYFMAEAAIIATDIAEVIGTAIAINLLIPQIPLVAGCAISICDVLLILLFYRPNGSMKGLRAFEFFVAALVLGVVICFCIQLSLIKDTSVGEVFRGYLPSSAIIESNGLYQACGILGATVMPHSLYLGSGIVQPRLLEFDIKNGQVSPDLQDPDSDPSRTSTDKYIYQPSLSAIRFCLNYSIAELAISLFTFALFVNSSILITAGASLSDQPEAQDASLFSIHELLASSLAPAAGTIFALALLLSGISAGIVCTIAGQMVSEGALNWSIAPWLRRLVTRSISITPSIIIAGAVGQDGLSTALNASQVALSIVLPFVSAPLIYFTCRNRYMTVKVTQENVLNQDDGDEEHEGGHRQELTDARVLAPVATATSSVPNTDGAQGVRAQEEGTNMTPETVSPEGVKMRNNWITAIFAVIIWGVIAVMNVANLVLLGLGKE